MTYLEALAFLKSIDLTMVRYERSSWDDYVKANGICMDFPFIHITGSNGKGTTASFIYHALLEAGYKAALFSKPFLYEEREMISVGGQEIDRDTFASYVERMKDGFVKYNLSSFEALVAVAYTYFSDCGVEIAVVECGMGGLLDATNIAGCKPLLSIITSVSMEHVKFLGPTLKDIVHHKCGIVKEGVPLLLGRTSVDIMNLVNEEAKLRKISAKPLSNFRIWTANPTSVDFTVDGDGPFSIPGGALYMVEDAVLAIDALSMIQDRFKVSEYDIRVALGKGLLPCRFEKIDGVIVDGAHNPAAVSALVDSLDAAYPSGEKTIVFASFRDKDVESELEFFILRGWRIVLTTFEHVRAMTHEDYLERGLDIEFIDDPLKALKKAREYAGDGLIVVTGSIAFASLIRNQISRREPYED